MATFGNDIDTALAGAGYPTTEAGAQIVADAIAAQVAAENARDKAEAAAVGVSAAAGSGIGDFSPKSKLLIFCGDSTTEQMQGTGFGFDRITNLHRQPGGKLESIIGTINFGGSGYTIDGWVSQAVGSIPVIQSATNAGVGAWDYYGHKPVGAISLDTAIAWREGKADRTVWVICYGINDCILNAAVGNMSQEQITAYVAERLIAGIDKIKAAYPLDDIVLRTPNPMTARPYNPAAGFPSATQYPAFGSDLEADKALVTKWNNALRDAYNVAARGTRARTAVLDTHSLVFGDADTSLLANTQLTFLTDLVHPGGLGYVGIADALADLLAPRVSGSPTRRMEAEKRAEAVGGSPLDYYPLYMRDNPAYYLVAAGDKKAIGASYIDVEIPLSVVYDSIDLSRPIYVQYGDSAAQQFSSYGVIEIGAGTRIYNISVSADMQSSVGRVEIYQKRSGVFSDPYILQQIASVKPRAAYQARVTAAGNGYIDVAITATPGEYRPSTKYIDHVKRMSLVVGGGINTTISLPTASVTRNGTTAQATIRVSVAGDYTSYANKACALFEALDAPAAVAAEVSATLRQVVAHAAGARGFVHCAHSMADGATLSAFLTEQIGVAVTVDVYRPAWPTRTLVGTITIPANASGASLSTGNPTFVAAGTIYEFVVSSATSQSTGLVGLAVTPV